MHPLEAYLDGLRGNSLATGETSNYPDIRALFNAYGKQLDPPVACVIHPKAKSGGGGIPDGAFFEARALKKAGELAGNVNWLQGALGQARAVIEVKGIDHDLDELIASPQVAKYLTDYGVALVTNLYGFALLKRGDDGAAVELERCLLTDSPAHFKSEYLKHPRKYAQQDGQRLEDFLKRAMLYSAPLIRPGDLAWWLASYAHDALRLMQGIAPDALKGIKKAFEDALGLHYNSAKAERFFVSSTVQTLFYGIFSAWVQWHRKQPGRLDNFQWKDTAELLTVPVLTSLFEQLTTQNLLRAQDGALRKILDQTQAVLNRVARVEFFQRFNEEHAVVYFYEPFLEAFDPELKKELGVWYTPPEIVHYMVERVDRVLREELKLADGLADPNVVILDPCCGTGSFLLEVVRRVHKTLQAKGADGLLASDLVKAVRSRIYGFEILTAPFVISHLQVALLLDELGAPLHTGERAAIYLTNALTGWLPPDKTKEQLTIALPDMQAERDAADSVKQSAPILVILGNPPYSGFAGVAVEEERGLTEAYKTVRKVAKPQGQGLNDLYVRFFRMAERRITQPPVGQAPVPATPQGIVCFISNYSWLDGLSHTGMREHYLDSFDKLWIDCLNGDKYKTGKRTPDGAPDPSVFSTPLNREGIQVGTAIATLLRLPNSPVAAAFQPPESGTATGMSPLQDSNDGASPALPAVHYRDWWGADKLAAIAKEAEKPGSSGSVWEALAPELGLGLMLRRGEVSTGYGEWAKITEVFPVSFPGVTTGRDEFLIDIDKDELDSRIRQYFDRSFTAEDLRSKFPKIMKASARYQPDQIRQLLVNRGMLLKSNGEILNLVRHCYHAFDIRWLYWEPESKLLDEKREKYLPHVFPENIWLEVRQRESTQEFSRGTITRSIAGDLGNGRSSFIPMMVNGTPDLWNKTPQAQANLSPQSSSYVESIAGEALSLFHHAVAMLHSPSYRSDNAVSLRSDFPRIPLPATADALAASAALGRRVAELLDVEAEVPGVAGPQGAMVKGELRPELKPIGRLVIDGPDRRLTAGWGSFGQGRTVMPGRGKVTPHAPTPEETDIRAQWAVGTGPRACAPDEDAQAGALAPTGFLTIHANDEVRWECVPRAVWDYTLGGYQVVKKWLSYREYKVLGRALHDEELREVQNMFRRIAALLLLGPELDANYSAVKADTYPWPPARSI